MMIDGQSYCFRAEEMAEAFQEAGIGAVFDVTPNTLWAMDTLRDWKARGWGLDLISCDINAMNGDSGVAFLEAFLDEVAQELGADMLPKKIFFHSADWRDMPIVTKYGTSPCVLDDKEFMELGWPQGSYNDSSCPHRILRDYLNAHWGTRFVMSEAEEKNLNDPQGPLTIHDVAELRRQQAITDADAFQRLVLREADDFTTRSWLAFPDEYSDRPCYHSFMRAVAGTVVGALAYNAEDVARLKAAQPQEPVILALDSAAGYEAPPKGVDGLIVLRDDVHAAHIRQVCDNMGIPALIGADERDRFDTCGMSESGELTIRNDRKESGPLAAGSGVTIDAYKSSGTLHAAKIPVMYEKDDYTKRLLAPLTVLAEAALVAAGIRIKAHADTAEQVRAAIANNADGVGLARTEHMFFTPEKRAVLRQYLLSAAPDDGIITSFRCAQEADFRAILEEAAQAEKDFPVTIRLLDAPPAEFMDAADMAAYETRLGAENMRGVQAGLRVAGLYEAQIAALCDAFAAVKFAAPLHVLVPNVEEEAEMDGVRALFNRHAAGTGMTLSPMVESKRYLDFLTTAAPLPRMVSYGTNDLTSAFMEGIVRNDAPRIMAWMAAHKCEGRNPFLEIMKPVRAGIAALQGRPDAPEATICGQQVADDERSIRWAAQLGLSLSVPFRYVPYAKLVAGQEALRRGGALTIQPA